MPDTTPPQSPSRMFAEPTPERTFPTTAVAIAATAIIILAAFLILLGRRQRAPSGTAQPAAAYAPSLIFSGVHMSDATTGSGGRLIYIEGHVANQGASTLTAATLQVIFANDTAMAPQIETAPLTLVYMREPYVDTRPVSASAPLAPNAEGDFRLIFDDVSDNWNQQLPQLRVVQASTRK